MSKWLARARSNAVPNVPKSPKCETSGDFGDFDNFGTAPPHPPELPPAPPIDPAPTSELAPDAAFDPADRQAFLDERAAMAAEGGVPEVYATAFARIQADCPPRVPEARWHQFIDDAGRFLDQWGAEAERLGWPAADLFGLHDVAPMSRVDSMGLLWLLKGLPVLALTADKASVATKGGGSRTFYRPACRGAPMTAEARAISEVKTCL